MPNFDLQFCHFGIYVRDLPKMTDFYHRVMGFPITDEGPLHGAQMVFFSRNPREHHQIVLVAGRPEGADDEKVINQLSFRVSSLGDIRRFYLNIRDEPSASEVRPICHGHAWSIYFRDPEGNRIEVYTDTPWYVPQPVREEIDFALPEDEIFRQSEALARSNPGFKTAEEWRRGLIQAIDDMPA